MTEELKPCPFCGGEARVARKSGHVGRVCPSRYYRERVICRKCGACGDEHKAPGKAIVAWNRRAPTLAAENERLKETLTEASRNAGEWEDLHQELFDAVMALFDPEYSAVGVREGPERDDLETVVKAHAKVHTVAGPYADQTSRPALAAENAALKALVAEMKSVIDGLAADIRFMSHSIQEGRDKDAMQRMLDDMQRKALDALITRAKEAAS